MTDKSNVEFSEREALFFHSTGRPGKIEIIASKPMATQRDLSLAYSPGVAVPVLAIAADAATAYDYTAKGNLVAVITNGTAVLGLGDIGPLAAKPVMECPWRRRPQGCWLDPLWGPPVGGAEGADHPQLCLGSVV